jgi:Skp family chaperone for outer membrane proteins
MKSLIKSALGAGIALATIASVPASAQVNGIATSRTAIAIAQSQALQTGYTAINQTYAAQLTLLQTLTTEIGQLETQLDTNQDGNITEAEASANPTVVQQLQAKQQQVDLALQPILVAELYVVEQLLNDYGNARSQVIADNQIALMIAPEAMQYTPEGADVTDKITAVINTRLPAVTTAVPAGWQPRQQTVTMHSNIQQLLVIQAQFQAAQAQQAAAANGGAAATSGEQPTGR